ncbi:MAG: glycoside hydrolase family 1 protein [Alphaproteobacteria bacterium]|nr:glycoside hydrolase family 1 protein [Alphaproteobacteria bacterium]
MLLFALLIGCTPEEPAPTGRPFPAGFRFGAATAGFQVDMGCPTWSDAECNDTASDWYQWVTDPGIIGTSALYVSGEPVSHGPGMWELFEEDVDRMKADGMTAYRMSIEWSRLFPDGAAESATTVDALAPHANAAAVQRYHAMFAALDAAGIEPVVTINHYVLPLWVHDGVACHDDIDTCPARGWVDRDRIVPLIGLYAGYVAREFGGEVDTWFTLNEPFATTASGYLMPGEDRSSPPGLSFAVPETVAVMRNQIDGHAAMYDAVKAEDPGSTVGIVMNMVDITPKDPERELDLTAVDHTDYLYHRLYLDAVTTGAWDDDLDGVPDRNRPDLAGRLDVLGINYYNELVVSGLPFAPAQEVPVFDFYPEFSWDPHPEGLGHVIERAQDWGVPVWVTENGTPHVEDQGAEILDGHLASLLDATDAGADVRGYLYWSYVDNYEWNHGFDLKFGLYGLDPDTKARIERPVIGRYREIVANGL